ncbi:MAG TPA: hypothetical protein VFI65_30180 [Streptosporangiaceae bacterium]|nr:hypothetical protein [Streptosporangiaceae bacterium]
MNEDEGRDVMPAEAAPPRSYAWYLVRRADWFDSGMALQCSGQSGGVFTDDGDILGEIRDGDGLDTLIRTADEHRPRCEWAAGAGDEGERQELTVEKRAEVHLEWATGSRAGRPFAVLHRLDYNVWDAWQQVAGQPPARLTRNGVSYELALMAVFRAMDDAMPEEFAVLYPPFELPAEQRTPSEAPLPMSYARYLIRLGGRGLSLQCSGQTGGVCSENRTTLARMQDGDSLDTLIQLADVHRPGCEWAVCPGDERERPELTVLKRAEVHLKWIMGSLAERNFAKLHRLDGNGWNAWLHPLHLEGQAVSEEPPVLLTTDGVSYEMALMAVFRAMGDEMPQEFTVVYLY